MLYLKCKITTGYQHHYTIKRLNPTLLTTDRGWSSSTINWAIFSVMAIAFLLSRGSLTRLARLSASMGC